MSDEPVVDRNTIEELSNLMGEEFIGELVETFCEETPQLMVQLRQSMDDGDAAAFRRFAHSIKSSSASLGALKLAAMARELEILGKEEHISGTEAALVQLEAAYHQAEQVLKAL